MIRKSHLRLASLLTAYFSIVEGSSIQLIQQSMIATSIHKSTRSHTMVSSPCSPYLSMIPTSWPKFSKPRISTCCLWFYRSNGLGITALVRFCNLLASESGIHTQTMTGSLIRSFFFSKALKHCAESTKHYSFLYFLPIKWMHAYQSTCWRIRTFLDPWTMISHSRWGTHSRYVCTCIHISHYPTFTQYIHRSCATQQRTIHILIYDLRRTS